MLSLTVRVYSLRRNQTTKIVWHLHTKRPKHDLFEKVVKFYNSALNKTCNDNRVLWKKRWIDSKMYRDNLQDDGKRLEELFTFCDRFSLQCRRFRWARNLLAKAPCWNLPKRGKGYYVYSTQSSTVIKSKMAAKTILRTRTRFRPPKIRLHCRLWQIRRELLGWNCFGTVARLTSRSNGWQFFWTDSLSCSNGYPIRSNSWWTENKLLSVRQRQTVRVRGHIYKYYKDNQGAHLQKVNEKYEQVVYCFEIRR